MLVRTASKSWILTKVLKMSTTVLPVVKKIYQQLLVLQLLKLGPWSVWSWEVFHIGAGTRSMKKLWLPRKLFVFFCHYVEQNRLLEFNLVFSKLFTIWFTDFFKKRDYSCRRDLSFNLLTDLFLPPENLIVLQCF